MKRLKNIMDGMACTTHLMRLTSVLILKVAVAAYHVGVNNTRVYFDLMPQLVDDSILLELLLEEDLDISSNPFDTEPFSPTA
jgi:hypothetical protein